MYLTYTSMNQVWLEKSTSMLNSFQ